MQNLISEDFYRIISQVSDENFEPSHIYGIFKKEIPAFAECFGIVLFKACVYMPVKNNREMQASEIEIYNTTNGQDCNTEFHIFPIGNGGRVEVTIGLGEDYEWTDSLKRDCYVMARTIYLLVSRVNTIKALMNMAFFDQMTGIPNETKLTQFMGECFEAGTFTEYCSNFLNIKNMKLMNSRYSDEAGNAVLIGYAKAVSEFVEEKCEGIAARLGGDNFFVFIKKCHEEEFLSWMKKIMVPYERPSGEKVMINVESRVGYYFIQEGDGINEAMRNADIAAKQARKPGNPDYVQFEEAMKVHILKIRQLEQNISYALDHREFVVYYQPKVDISNTSDIKVNGAEALVRWKKDGEMVSPGEFIPVLEKNGLITLVDFYVLEQVCMDINRWIDQGIQPIKVSSNFSRRHLQDGDFADKVEEIIKKYNVDPKYIEIEITESYDDEDMQALSKFEKRMHELGIDLSVDDFGSGFSSLKMIKNIVADTIKLDKSIIDGIGNDGSEDIIVSHIIMMILHLGKNVIAEGVETEQQASFLRKNGCNNIQGFLYGRPCAREEFEERYFG